MRVFFDTSAFVKRYVEEPGTARVVEVCAHADELILSVVCVPEIISMLNRLVQEGRLSSHDYGKMRSLVLREIEDTEVCHLTPVVIGRTIKCLENYPLRVMEALHIGCALLAEPDLFVSSDPRQIEAAKREGLTVIEA